ncbi:hypothetical protein FCM35_KLT21483 [Carex littledalei]|uniref:Uncharacterized protein n=1 Tax=Carex littledalei TaxID=544730 RepID=A0A833RGQ3_9POAL|nr:hypothetical protein FCM35_KLT21483 [Carex littledalei]
MSDSIQQQPFGTNPEKIVAQNATSNSNNSFTPVFIVLAIILVLAVVSCIVGRFCSKQYLRPRRRKDHVAHNMENGMHMGKIEARVEQAREVAANPNSNAIIVAVLDAKSEPKMTNIPSVFSGY